MRTSRIVVLWLLGTAAALAAAPDIPGPDFKTQLSLRDAGGPRISPDGSRIVFSVRRTDWENNRFDSELWMAAGSEVFPLTSTPGGSSSNAAFSPDGRWVAFQATRDDKAQVHVMRADGGEARAVTDVAEGVNDFEWSPDGRHIAFTASEPKSEQEKEREKQLGRFAVEDEERQHQHLWVVEVSRLLDIAPHQKPCFEKGRPDGATHGREQDQSGNTDGDDEREEADEPECRPLPAPRRLTEGEYTVRNFRWSPDGSRLAFERRDGPEILSFFSADVYLIDAEGGEPAPLVTRPGFDGNPRWSPDSSWVLYSSDSGDTTSNFYSNGHLYRVRADGSDDERLAAEFDENMSVADWNPRGIYFLAWQRTTRRLFRLDPDSGSVTPAGTSPDQIWSVSFSADGSTVAVSAEAPGGLDEVYRSAIEPWQPVPLTRMSEQVSGWELGTREVVSWSSRDGTEIEGVLYKPSGFEEGRKYPLFVVIHGGPTGIDYPSAVPGTVYPMLQWLGRGALVLRPNYRGSAGYGEAFRSLNVRNLGVGDAWDVLSGVDHLIERGIVDVERMGAMGWSQGGYISAFLTTNTDRFQAISVGAGISDWMTYYVNTDIHPFTRQYLQATPWDDPEIYALTSPITNVQQASTPTLIQHGEFDRRVPIPNAYQLYQGLQDQGVETRLIVYKGFGHGINKPRERLAALQHNWEWFARHVWKDEQ